MFVQCVHLVVEFGRKLELLQPVEPVSNHHQAVTPLSCGTVEILPNVEAEAVENALHYGRATSTSIGWSVRLQEEECCS